MLIPAVLGADSYTDRNVAGNGNANAWSRCCSRCREWEKFKGNDGSASPWKWSIRSDDRCRRCKEALTRQLHTWSQFFWCGDKLFREYQRNRLLFIPWEAGTLGRVRASDSGRSQSRWQGMRRRLHETTSVLSVSLVNWPPRAERSELPRMDCRPSREAVDGLKRSSRHKRDARGMCWLYHRPHSPHSPPGRGRVRAAAVRGVRSPLARVGPPSATTV